jgi:GNAT superfamily N-acetyltransferase
MPSAAEAVLTFLESVGRRSEAELYLRLFQRLPKESFALIAPANTAVRQGLGTLVEQLRFLADLGLSAPVVIGLFHPAAAAVLEPRLVRRLESAALSPVPLSWSEPELEARLRDELGKGKTPILSFADDGADVAARFGALAQLAAALATRKLVLVRRHGGLELVSERYEPRAQAHFLDVDRGAVSLVNLRTDAEPLLGQKLLRREDAELLEHVRALLDASAPHAPLVSVTSPFNLLTELFTLKGAGTLIKPGSAIRRLASYAETDRARLEALLETSFGRKLEPGLFSRSPLALFLEEEYRGAAIVEPGSVAPYLSKFAVEPVAQGEGIGRDLWRAMAREFPRLFWRTRAGNPIASWYFSVCDGMVRSSDWNVFWRGIETDLVPQIVEAALGVRDDFVRGAGA